MQIYASWEELEKAGKDGSNSNVGRYIYIGKGKLWLSFLKHAILRAILQRLRATGASAFGNAGFRLCCNSLFNWFDRLHA
ncbi:MULTISPECIES: hypothetical protein [unclassified Microcoleus]|uniref:hypothetical protein n=1 Tax=unclassified Microcoleus TaxID=2642155 RepID=UPI002FD487CF